LPKERPPKIKDDIPSWFVTFSDVITLLMTFFVLLLTFSTDEPEHFEKFQQTMFRGSGARGIAGPRAAGPDRDSFFVRMRPSLARMVLRGSEMPPTCDEPDSVPLGLGLEGLEAEEKHDPTMARSIEVPLLLLVTRGGDITPRGEQQLRMLARQLHHMSLHVSLQVAGEEQLSSLMAIAQYLVQHGKVPPGKIGTSLTTVRPDYVRIVMMCHVNG
jgi:hypothetical protein